MAFWKKPPLIANPTLRWSLWVGGAIYLAIAFGTMEVNWQRVAEGTERGHRFIRFSYAEAHATIAEAAAVLRDWMR